MYSNSIEQLIQEFKKLPTVGQKTAERFVFKLLKSGKKQVGELTLALKRMSVDVKSCEKCWDFSDSTPCQICSNTERSHKTLCIVAESQDKQAIEKTKEFNGIYFILRGVIQPDQENLKYTKIKELITKLKQDKIISEILLAFNPDMNGETTMMYLEKQIKVLNPQIKITRLARGLPMNSDLQYADEITLGSALKNRR
jgi:recombination protein RecR